MGIATLGDDADGLERDVGGKGNVQQQLLVGVAVHIAAAVEALRPRLQHRRAGAVLVLVEAAHLGHVYHPKERRLCAALGIVVVVVVMAVMVVAVAVAVVVIWVGEGAEGEEQ